MEWRIITTNENYEVSDMGMVRRRTVHKLNRRWALRRPLTQQLNKTGYLRVKLSGRYVFVARLVGTAFLGPPPTRRHQINHRDGNKTNNRWTNLEWVTHSENIQHALRLGLYKPVRGEAHGMSKLTEGAVREIRATQRQTKRLAAKYGVSTDLIRVVRRREIWKHV